MKNTKAVRALLLGRQFPASGQKDWQLVLESLFDVLNEVSGNPEGFINCIMANLLYQQPREIFDYLRPAGLSLNEIPGKAIAAILEAFAEAYPEHVKFLPQKAKFALQRFESDFRGDGHITRTNSSNDCAVITALFEIGATSRMHPFVGAGQCLSAGHIEYLKELSELLVVAIKGRHFERSSMGGPDLSDFSRSVKKFVEVSRIDKTSWQLYLDILREFNVLIGPDTPQKKLSWQSVPDRNLSLVAVLADELSLKYYGSTPSPDRVREICAKNPKPA